MTKNEVRLEILKLIHRHDQEPEQILVRASKLEEWVSEVELQSEGAKAPSSRGKRSGNAAKEQAPV